MSRRKDNYENSRWLKFKRWIDGEVDPLSAKGVEMADPRTAGHAIPESGGPGSTASVRDGLKHAASEKGVAEYAVSKSGSLKETVHLPAPAKMGTAENQAETGERDKEALAEQLEEQARDERGLRIYRKIYQVMSVILCLGIIAVLLWTIAYLPIFGNAGNPDNNEVSARYIEQGLKETGAVNIVTGMILDYRAFDTFGESCVLFIASCCVLVLLRTDSGSGTNDRIYEPKEDVILQRCASVLVPIILVFGIYIILNGHLSPGGGFSGGAVIGSGLILYLNAFGFERTEKLFNGRVYRRVTVSALTFYCLAKSYSFFTGANHLESGIPLGTPGNILSSGLILPLNICVGMVVACTMYAFYSLFRKGGI